MFHYDDQNLVEIVEVLTPSGVLDIKVNHDILGVALSQGSH